MIFIKFDIIRYLLYSGFENNYSTKKLVLHFIQSRWYGSPSTVPTLAFSYVLILSLFGNFFASLINLGAFQESRTLSVVGVERKTIRTASMYDTPSHQQHLLLLKQTSYGKILHKSVTKTQSRKKAMAMQDADRTKATSSFDSRWNVADLWQILKII